MSTISLMTQKQTGAGSIYIILLVIILIIIVGAGAYYFGTKQVAPALPTSPLSTPSPNKTNLPIPTASSSALPSISPSSNPSISPALLENIKASIISKNTAALEGYMTEPVNVMIEATECCGMLTRVNAIKEMDYLNSATLPWNFDDNNPIALQLKQKNPSAFPDGIIIGTSANRLLVTFTLTADKTKIEKVYMAADYKLHGI